MKKERVPRKLKKKLKSFKYWLHLYSKHDGEIFDMLDDINKYKKAK